jgi:hypothetical protein
MRHNLYFHTVNDAQKVLEIIKRGFTPDVVSDKTMLSFTTPYKIREVLQSKILQGVIGCKSDLNVEEKNG